MHSIRKFRHQKNDSFPWIWWSNRNIKLAIFWSLKRIWANLIHKYMPVCVCEIVFGNKMANDWLGHVPNGYVTCPTKATGSQGDREERDCRWTLPMPPISWAPSKPTIRKHLDLKCTGKDHKEKMHSLLWWWPNCSWRICPTKGKQFICFLLLTLDLEVGEHNWCENGEQCTEIRFFPLTMP